MLLGAGEEWNTPRAPDFGANVQYHGNAMQYELIKRRIATFTSKSRVLRLAANLSGQKGHVQDGERNERTDKCASFARWERTNATSFQLTKKNMTVNR